MRIRFLHTESFRLTAIYVVVFALSLAALGGFVLATTQAAMRDQIVQFAQADIAAIRDGYVHEGVNEAREVILQRLAGAADFILLQKDGSKLAGNLPAMTPVNGVAEIRNPTGQGKAILGVGVTLAPGFYAFSGSDLNYVAAVYARILNVLIWLFAAALLPATLLGTLISRSFLARMDAIAHTCRAIMAGDLKDRVPVRGSQDELDRLATTINAMLNRIAALMENIRQVTNDVAHDLRTPLTHLRQRLERARAQSQSPAEYAAALDGAIASTDDILSLFAALLRIAQIEGGARRAGFGALNLSALLQRIKDVYGAVAEDAGHCLVVHAAAPCQVRGDQELLFQLFANLIENAIVHTPPGTRIFACLEMDATQATLTVQDDGPGVAAAEHGKLFRRFYRGDASRSKPGHGLGLALVAAVAELHGGAVAIEASSAEKGMVIKVTLPCIEN